MAESTSEAFKSFKEQEPSNGTFQSFANDDKQNKESAVEYKPVVDSTEQK